MANGRRSRRGSIISNGKPCSPGNGDRQECREIRRIGREARRRWTSAGPQEMPPPGGHEASRTRRKWLRLAAVCCGLMLLVVLAYGQVWRNDFVLCDDDEYIYRNPWVLRGLTPETISWAIWEPHFANWHPLTWMSHMLDWDLFGPWAGGHHLETRRDPCPQRRLAVGAAANDRRLVAQAPPWPPCSPSTPFAWSRWPGHASGRTS